MTYKQCKLKKGKQETTSWIPSKFAIPGKALKLSGDDGWVVESVSREELTGDKLTLISREHTRHRKRTDI